MRVERPTSWGLLFALKWGSAQKRSDTAKAPRYKASTVAISRQNSLRSRHSTRFPGLAKNTGPIWLARVPFFGNFSTAPDTAAVDPFRRGRIHDITRRRTGRAGPACRGSSRASIPRAGVSARRRAAAVGWINRISERGGRPVIYQPQDDLTCSQRNCAGATFGTCRLRKGHRLDLGKGGARRGKEDYFATDQRR